MDIRKFVDQEFDVISNAGNGDCMYLALLQGLNTTQISVLDLRNAVAVVFEVIALKKDSPVRRYLVAALSGKDPDFQWVRETISESPVSTAPSMDGEERVRLLTEGDVEALADRIRSDLWGDELTLFLASRILLTNVVVFSIRGSGKQYAKEFISKKSSHPERALALLHSGAHYELLVPKAGSMLRHGNTYVKRGVLAELFERSGLILS